MVQYQQSKPKSYAEKQQRSLKNKDMHEEYSERPCLPAKKSINLWM